MNVSVILILFFGIYISAINRKSINSKHFYIIWLMKPNLYYLQNYLDYNMLGVLKQFLL